VAGDDAQGRDVRGPARDRVEVALGERPPGDAEQPLRGLLPQCSETAAASCSEDDDVGGCGLDAVLRAAAVVDGM
jgi:hypothetical protein